MDGKTLLQLGKISGLAGIAFGFIFITFKGIIDVVLKSNFELSGQQAYKIILSVLLLSFGATIIGTIAWLFGRNFAKDRVIPSSAIAIIGALSLAVFGGVLIVLLDLVKIDGPIIDKSVIGIRSDEPAKSPETSVSRVEAFTYRANDPGDEGFRYWTRPTTDRWIETKASGRKIVFEHLNRINVGYCDGNLVAKVGEKDLQIFIPDKGCGNMEIKFRRGMADSWKGLPDMIDIK